MCNMEKNQAKYERDCKGGKLRALAKKIPVFVSVVKAIRRCFPNSEFLVVPAEKKGYKMPVCKEQAPIWTDLPDNSKSKQVKDLNVAAIMDEFSFKSFQPECNLISIRPDNWKE